MQREVVPIIQRARDVLVRDGWTQGAEVNHVGQRCLIGALNFAASTSILATNMSRLRLQDEVLSLFQGLVGVIPDWNDSPGRTFNDVLLLLDAAETIAKGETSGDVSHDDQDPARMRSVPQTDSVTQ